jgi:hypothetical protein
MGICTQSFVLARQLLYHLSHISSPSLMRGSWFKVSLGKLFMRPYLKNTTKG